MKTIESLGIYWTFESDTEENYQDEVDGLIFYGYWGDKPFELPSHESFISFWGDSEIELKMRIWDGERMAKLSIEIYIKKWPSEKNWMHCIKQSLIWFIEAGARIAWCGTESSTPSIDIFDSSRSLGGMYAAFSPEIGFFCNSNLNDTYEELSNEQMLKFFM